MFATSSSEGTLPALKVPFAVSNNFPKWLSEAELAVQSEALLRQNHGIPGRKERVTGAAQQAADACQKPSMGYGPRVQALQSSRASLRTIPRYQ